MQCHARQEQRARNIRDGLLVTGRQTPYSRCNTASPISRYSTRSSLHCVVSSYHKTPVSDSDPPAALDCALVLIRTIIPKAPSIVLSSSSNGTAPSIGIASATIEHAPCSGPEKARSYEVSTLSPFATQSEYGCACESDSAHALGRRRSFGVHPNSDRLWRPVQPPMLERRIKHR